MNLKRYLSSVLLTGGWFYINYQIYMGFDTGEFNPIGKGVGVVSLDESPIWFYIAIGVTIIFSVLCSALILWSICNTLDRKFRAYGGNYNLNTFKAILRGLRK